MVVSPDMYVHTRELRRRLEWRCCGFAAIRGACGAGATMGRESGSSKAGLKQPKRSRVAASAEQLLSSFARLFTKPSIHTNSHVYDVQKTGERSSLIDALWAETW
eukprot:2293640-Pleurochrysis_carterae.AAC.1